MNKAELDMHRKNTAAFIAADPVKLTLVTQKTKRTSSGGVVPDGDPVPRKAQTFRLIPSGDRTSEVRLTSGRVAQVTHVILGAWDSLMERDDTFSFNGEDYVIAGPIRPEHSVDSVYERKSEVVRRG
jgi:hypothetical protein